MTAVVIYYLLLPLLSGFFWVTTSRHLKYRFYRANTLIQILLLLSLGFLTSIIGVVLYPYIKAIVLGGGEYTSFMFLLWEVVRGQLMMGGEVTQSFNGALLGLCLTLLVFSFKMGVVVFSHRKPKSWLARKYINYDRTSWEKTVGSEHRLLKLLHNCHLHGCMVMIALKGGKVYLGYALSTIGIDTEASSPDSYFKIMPYRSGYRDPKTMRIIWTADYARLMEHVMNAEKDIIKEGEDCRVDVTVNDEGEVQTYTGESFSLLLKDIPVLVPLSEIETAKAWFPYMANYLDGFEGDEEEVEMKLVKVK